MHAGETIRLKFGRKKKYQILYDVRKKTEIRRLMQSAQHAQWEHDFLRVAHVKEALGIPLLELEQAILTTSTLEEFPLFLRYLDPAIGIVQFDAMVSLMNPHCFINTFIRDRGFKCYEIEKGLSTGRPLFTSRARYEDLWFDPKVLDQLFPGKKPAKALTQPAPIRQVPNYGFRVLFAWLANKIRSRR